VVNTLPLEQVSTISYFVGIIDAEAKHPEEIHLIQKRLIV
jgi:hypothetical protein